MNDTKNHLRGIAPENSSNHKKSVEVEEQKSTPTLEDLKHATQKALLAWPLACPHCGAATEKKLSKRGRSAGTEFWSCSKFPKCHGTLPLEEQK